MIVYVYLIYILQNDIVLPYVNARNLFPLNGYIFWCVLYTRVSKQIIYYFDIYQPSLNSNVPNRSQQESKLYYRTKNRLQIIENVRQWQKDNRERFNKYQKEYKQNKKNLLSPLINNVIQAVY